MSEKNKFILAPIIQIVEEANVSCSLIGNGIDTYPLCEYVMQSTFLKLTGASEQKLKFILWELASSDYEFRYNFLKNDYGECSNYEAKEKVFLNLLTCIKRYNLEYDVPDSEKKELLDYTINSCKTIFSNSIMVIWLSRHYQEFGVMIDKLSISQIMVKGKTYKLFSNKENLTDSEKIYNLKDAFENMYIHRNRCAHNLSSHQENLPSMIKMNSNEYLYENWFVRFFVLFLLDEIFIKIYKDYIKANKENSI